MAFTNEEKLEIVKTFWCCGCSPTLTRRYLNRKDRSKFGKLGNTAIYRLVRKLESDGSFERKVCTGRPRTSTSAENIERVRRKLNECPEMSIRMLGRELDISYSSIWIIVNEFKKS